MANPTLVETHQPSIVLRSKLSRFFKKPKDDELILIEKKKEAEHQRRLLEQARREQLDHDRRILDKHYKEYAAWKNDPNKNHQGNLFHFAAERSYFEMLAYALEHPKSAGSINSANDQDQFPTCVALENDHGNMFVTLLRSGGQLHPHRGVSPLRVAIVSGKPDVLKHVMEVPELYSGLSTPDASGQLPLEIALDHERYPAALKLLRSKRGGPNSGHQPPMRLEQSLDLLFHPTQPCTDKSLTSKERKTRQLEVLKLLVEGGVDINVLLSDGRSALHNSVRLAHHEVFCHLLQQPTIKVNIKDNRKRTPLFDAVERNSLVAMEILLSNGADVSARDTVGETALFGAVLGRKQALVACLLKNRSATDARNNDGWTPLLLAAFNGDLTISKLILLQSKRSLSLTAPSGESPLLVACKFKHRELVEFLIQSGANINQKDDQGKSPLEYATAAGWNDVVKALIQMTSQLNPSTFDSGVGLAR